jgi:hypothetical protein
MTGVGLASMAGISLRFGGSGALPLVAGSNGEEV